MTWGFGRVVALSLSTMMTAACGTLVGVGAAGGAAVGAVTDNDVGKRALIGVGALDGAIYDITR